MTTNTHTPKTPFIIAAAAGLATGALATTGVFLATTNSEAEAVTPNDCVTALDHADRAMELYSDTLNHTADTLEAYRANDGHTMDVHTEAIRINNEELYPLLDDFKTTKTQCIEDAQ
jgi:hypothetical protein